MPPTDIYEILNIDTNEIINECYSEILHTEYKNKGMDHIPDIQNEEDIIQFIKTWGTDNGNDTDNENKTHWNGMCRYYGQERDKFYNASINNDHDQILCNIILNVLYDDSYNNENKSKKTLGVELTDSLLFKHKKVETYFFDKFECNKLGINHKNYLLDNIRYLYNKFELLLINQFQALKLIPVKLLLDNPKLSYFCVFPYVYDPSISQNYRKKKNKSRNDDELHQLHGVTFIHEYDKCYSCAPWIVNDKRNCKPDIDEELFEKLKYAILSIVFNNPGIDLYRLYREYLLRFLLTPLQIFQMCKMLKIANKIKIIHYESQATTRFFAVL